MRQLKSFQSMQPSHVTNFISPPAVVSGKEGQLSPKLAVHFEYMFSFIRARLFSHYTRMYPTLDSMS